MDPKWVMSNEEKRARFKHYFKKKDEKLAAEAAATMAQLTSAESSSRGRRYHPYDQPQNRTRPILPK
jgi:hypothetical protein